MSEKKDSSLIFTPSFPADKEPEIEVWIADESESRPTRLKKESELELLDELSFVNGQKPVIDAAEVAKKRLELKASTATYEELLECAAQSAAEADYFFQLLVEYERGLLAAALDNGSMQDRAIETSALNGNLVARITLHAIRTLQSGKGRLNANRRLKNDPKAAAKIKAKELWNDWQEGRMIHRGKAAWARYVQSLYPILESTKTIEDWATDWAREKKKHSAS